MPKPDAPDPQGSIDANEVLGREERSQSAARRAHRKLVAGMRGQARVNKFTPPKNRNDLSVSRMDAAPEDALAAIAIRNAEHSGRAFWGWYTLTARDVEAAGCTAQPSPLLDNPHHADIVLPVALDAEDRRDALREYAMDLAYRVTFRPWGDWVVAQ